jgi:hypothetical protein
MVTRHTTSLRALSSRLWENNSGIGFTLHSVREGATVKSMRAMYAGLMSGMR